MNIVSLLSGGLDSCTAAVLAKDRWSEAEFYGLSVSYGQRHVKELSAAAKIAARLGFVKHLVLDVPLNVLGGSSLVYDGEIPEYSDDTKAILPTTFVPGRNAVMLSIAFGWAYTLDAEVIVGGWNALDYSGYPDCRKEFLEAMEKAGSLAIDQKIQIYTPLVTMTKVDIIQNGTALNAPFELTWSCYQGGDVPCGKCDSCHYRQEGFKAAGIKDPALEV